ncbi:MAG: hypothetical protein H7X71_07680 [Chitinophagales bacterium]|nr:hypothetical protein [Chitinophagales bacterium]
MKIRFIFLFLIFFGLLSCNNKSSTEIYELVKQTEKIQIVFNTRLDKYTDITERRDIRKFDDYISEEDTPIYNCGYDGYIIFFGEQGSVRMDFNLSDDCQHVLYIFGDVLQTKKLTPDGLEYLRSLQPK